MMKHLLTSILTLALLMMASCNDDSCYDNGNSLPLVRFYMSGSGKVDVKGITLRGVDAPGDSIYVNKGTLSETYLPLRATKNSTQWIIQLTATDNSTIADTLSLDYTPVPYFASAECGAMFSFDLNKVDVTHNIIDSVVVVKEVITNVSQENLRIYFKNQQ